jgi:type II secretory pathway component HofQ
MGSNKSGKQVSFKKIVTGPRVSVSNQNKKITTDPTPNKGDPGSLTIVAHDTGPLVSVSRRTVRGLLKISHLYLL